MTDNKIGTFDCGSTSLSPGGTTSCTADYSTTQADVDNLGVTNSATASGTNPQSLPIFSTPASTTVMADPTTPGISFTKGSTSTYSKPNELITFTFDIQNTGQTTINNISISDPIVQNLKCPTTTVLPGPQNAIQCTAQYRTTQTDVDNTKVVNTATVTGNNPPNVGGTLTATSTATVEATLSPGVTIAKSSTSGNYDQQGQIIRYNYVVKNTGNDVLNITVTDDKITGQGHSVMCPSGTDVVSLEPSMSVTCYADYTVQLADVNGGSLTNTATASGVNPNDPQQKTVTAQSKVTLTALQESGLSVLKTASNSQGPITTYNMQGESITYTYKVTNTGKDTISNIAVTDDKISGTICTIPSLDPGDSASCTATYIITLADMNNGSLTNTGIAKGVNPIGTPTSAMSPPVTLTANLFPSIIMVKTPSSLSYSYAGEVITYSFKVTNTGNDTIKNIAITDPLITSGITCPVTSVNPNNFITCTGNYTIKLSDIDSGTVSNTATATGKNNQNTSVSAQGSAMITATQNPSMNLVKTSTSSGYSIAGETVNYEYTVKNTGNDTLSAITVTDAVNPPGSGPVTVNCPPNNSIAPGASLTCTGTYIVTEPDVVQGSIINTAQAFGQNSKMTSVQSQKVSYTLNSTLKGQLTLVKTANVSDFSTIDVPITYTYTVTNTGNDVLTNIAVTDHTIPQPITCDKTTLQPFTVDPSEATATCTGNYLTTQDDLNNGGVTNYATASGKDPQGTLVGSNPFTLFIMANQTGTLDFSKTIPAGTTYSIGLFINDRLSPLRSLTTRILLSMVLQLLIL